MTEARASSTRILSELPVFGDHNFTALKLGHNLVLRHTDSISGSIEKEKTNLQDLFRKDFCLLKTAR